MGEKIKFGPGTIYIDGVAYDGALVSSSISTEEIEEDIRTYVEDQKPFLSLNDSGELSCTVRINRIQLLKVIGLWELIRRNCPSPRVRHLMEHGSERTRYKNYKHACRLVSKMVRRRR